MIYYPCRHKDDVTGRLFLFLVQLDARFRKFLQDYFALSKWGPRKNFSRSCFQVETRNKPRQREFLSKLEEMLKCDENRAVFGNAIFAFLFSFWASDRPWKRFRINWLHIFGKSSFLLNSTRFVYSIPDTLLFHALLVTWKSAKKWYLTRMCISLRTSNI